MTDSRPAQNLDLSRPLRIHIIGIGGAGMSSIATILAEQGHDVSGSDAKDSENLQRLASKGVQTFVGHSGEHLGSAELVLRSTAVNRDNPELIEAESRDLVVLNRTDFLPMLARQTPFVSISGTHGKTTTSSMTAVAMEAAGADPSFLIGSFVNSLGASAGHRSGVQMVLEADESDGSFLAGPRAGALVTNVEADHMDFWGSWDALVGGFRKFLDTTDGPRVVCSDDPILAGMRSEVGAVGYGFDDSAEYRIRDLVTADDRTVVSLTTPAGAIEFSLGVPGRYNALNATGALALVHSLGYDIVAAAGGLGGYSGVSRRFERRGSIAGIDFVDDYAHHPTELKAVIGAATSGRWGRVVATFQPHRYSRTQAVWEGFATAFDGVDLLVVTDIYSAGEPSRTGIDGKALAEAIAASSAVQRVEYRASLDEAAAFLADELNEGDLSLSLGAGDVTTLADRVQQIIRGREGRSAGGNDG